MIQLLDSPWRLHRYLTDIHNHFTTRDLRCTLRRYNELVANLPEDYQQYAEDIYNAQTTGDVAKDVGGVLTDISIKLVRDTFGRKLLRAS